MIEYTKEDLASFYRKKSGLRQDILAQDWKDDKAIRMGGGQIPFLSSDKIKKTVAPLFSKHGLELETEFSDLMVMEGVQGNQNHVSLKLTAKIIDIDSGYSTTSSAYGEAGDNQDKAIGKAQTYAMKYWLMSEFQICDGIDPDTLAAAASASSGTGFYKKTPEEQEEVKSKVLEQSIKPKEDAHDKKPAESVKPEAPVKKKAHEVDQRPAPVEEKPAAKAEEPVEKSEDLPEKTSEAPAEHKFVPTGPQAKTIDRIVEKWTSRAKNGEVTPDEYNRMSADRATMSSSQDAIAFIRKYRVGA